MCIRDRSERHKLIQCEEKPHKCTQCDYATAQTGYLRDHIKTHSTKKPNQCNWRNFLQSQKRSCLLYTSDAADDMQCECVGGFSNDLLNQMTYWTLYPLPLLLTTTVCFFAYAFWDCTCVITFCALVWLFSSVNADVPLQSFCSVEWAPALFTVMCLLSTVGEKMLGKIFFVIEENLHQLQWFGFSVECVLMWSLR